MMWGCMLWDGVGYACKIDGRMGGELYTKILQDELQESLSYYGKDPSSIIFQQDNDPKHKSKMARTCLEDHGFQVLSYKLQGQGKQVITEKSLKYIILMLLIYPFTWL